MAHSPARILLLGQLNDAPGELDEALAGLDLVPLRAAIHQAPALLAAGDVALVLVGAASSSGEGELAARVRDLRAATPVPVIAMAPPGASHAAIEAAYAAGAVDVLCAPLMVAALRAKASYFLQLQQTSAGHRRSEEALRDTRAQLDATLAAAELATWNLDVRTNRVVADPLLARLFGVSPDEAASGPLAAYLRAIHPDDLEDASSRIANAVATGLPYDASYRVRGADGRYRHVIARGQLSHDADGAPAVLRGVIIDVTREKETQEELRASEERYRTLFESVDDGVCVIEMLYDANGQPCDYRFLETNSAFVDHTGLDDAVGKTIGELAPGHEERWFTIYGKVAATGEPVRFVDEARALNRWFDVYATRVGGPGSTRLAVLFTDISEQVRADAELRRLADDLAANDRRKTEFLATLAHELRNPLAPLRSGLHVLRIAGGDAATAARVQDIMERQLSHLVTLVDDLLDVARITRGQVELRRAWIDLGEVLASAIETSRPLIDAEQHQLVLDLPDAPLSLFADATRLRQIVSNLLNNAAKYTPRGGRIALGARTEAGCLLLTVADNGIGIAPAMLSDVFEMFTQVGRERDRARGGLGIGLSLVLSLARLHGGSALAASAGPGFGSIFTVRLPLGDPARPGLDPAGPDGACPPAPAAGLRIMVVDDNIDAAATLAELLGLNGHTVAVANSGRQGLDEAAAFAPQVMFLDIGMPGMDGYQTARALRCDARHAQMLLVALTGWGGAEDRARTREAGFDLHLTKPVNLDDVARLLARHAAGQD